MSICNQSCKKVVVRMNNSMGIDFKLMYIVDNQTLTEKPAYRIRDVLSFISKHLGIDITRSEFQNQFDLYKKEPISKYLHEGGNPEEYLRPTLKSSHKRKTMEYYSNGEYADISNKKFAILNRNMFSDKVLWKLTGYRGYFLDRDSYTHDVSEICDSINKYMDLSETVESINSKFNSDVVDSSDSLTYFSLI